MNNLENFHWKCAPFEWLIVTLLLWELLWKAIAMWKSARNNHLVMFILITILNTLGIFSIIYVVWDIITKRKHIKQE